jgi:hypothetical protein
MVTVTSWIIKIAIGILLTSGLYGINDSIDSLYSNAIFAAIWGFEIFHTLLLYRESKDVRIN